MRLFQCTFTDNKIFNCLSCSRYRYKKGFMGTEHMHPYAEIFFVTEGEGYFYLRNKKVPICRGTIVVINGNVQHAEAAHPKSEMEYVVLCVDNLSFSLSQDQAEEQSLFFDVSDKYEQFMDMIRSMECEWTDKPPFWQSAMQTKANSFILSLLRYENVQALQIDAVRKPNVLAEVHSYLTRNYDEVINLDLLADVFCMNKYYLVHAYKEKYGKSIIQMLNQIRCQNAREILKESNFSIGAIAKNVGYESGSYFTKVYRKIYHETPTETRRKFLQYEKK